MGNTDFLKTKACLEQEIDRLEKKKLVFEKYEKKLSKYDNKYLKKRGNYYCIVEKRQKERIEKYAGDFSHKEVREIAAYKYIKRALRIIDRTLLFRKWQLKNGASIEPGSLMEYMPKAYRQQSRYIYELTDSEGALAWFEKEWEFSDKYLEAKKYRTKDGWLVRSKSELLLADKFASNALHYVYEGIHYIDGIAVAPDFTLYSVKHKRMIIWEHFGLMDDPEYAFKAISKIQMYERSGFILGYDLICTFEYKGKNLNMEAIDLLIEEYF